MDNFKKFIEHYSGIVTGCYCPACTQEKQIQCKDCTKFISDEITLEMYIKAVWVINRKDKYDINMDCDGIIVYIMSENKITDGKHFQYKDYGNSEQKTLEKALEFIYKQE